VKAEILRKGGSLIDSDCERVSIGLHWCENMEEDMEIKVALIGPDDLVQSITMAAKAFPALKLFPFGYKHEQETLQHVLQCKDEVDVLLFAGPIPYQIAREHVEEKKPMIYLPYTGTSLYRVFFQLIREKNFTDKGHRLRFSIDILRKEEVEERLDELELPVEKMFVKEYHIGQQTSEIVQFHYDLWINREVDAVRSSKLTAAELANGMGITIRSARRILSKLEQSHLANVIGEEQPVSKGRPRQLYHLKLDM
jgi:hypothetical protein